MEEFGVRLRRAMDTRGPLCVGIDPHSSLLARWGLPDTVDGLATFCRTVVGALRDHVAVFKPQSAFFERFGSAGIAVLETTIRGLRSGGALVLLDVKRGDIGSTAQAYGQAYLSPASPLHVDAITVNVYPGFGSIAPILDEAEAHGAGVFVVALTSNPEGAQMQQARVADGRTVAQVVLDEVARRNAQARPMGSVGVVVGATADAAGHDLTHLNGPILAPGMGTQGGTAADLRRVFAGVSRLVLPSYSREILKRGPGAPGLWDAVADTQRQCRNALEYPDL
jgi:orotidine-5'-phosphate decarboxylase